MVCRMALSTSQILAAGVSLILTASPAWPQSGEKLPAEMRSIGPADPGLSVECTVPDGQLFVLAHIPQIGSLSTCIHSVHACASKPASPGAGRSRCPGQKPRARTTRVGGAGTHNAPSDDLR